jgi:hypothetical protein
MANVLHRITKQYIVSANTPDYDPAEWIINPDMTPTIGIPSDYWSINQDDTVSVDRLSFVKKSRKLDVETQRDAVLFAGFTWKGIHFDSDQRAIQNIAGMAASVASGVPLPAGFVWRATNNTNVPMAENDVLDFGATLMDRIGRIYAVSWFHKGNIDACQLEAQVMGYPISLGWPA